LEIFAYLVKMREQGFGWHISVLAVVIIRRPSHPFAAHNDFGLLVCESLLEQ
jgi:hypothetical protein